MPKYEVIVYWEEDGQAGEADIPELAEQIVEGPTRSEALKSIIPLIRNWAAAVGVSGDPLPRLSFHLITVSAIPPETSMRSVKRIYRSLFYDLSDMLRTRQPVFVVPDPPEDEFYSEAHKIIDRLDEATSARELAQIMREVFVKTFDEKMAGPISRYAALAEGFWKTCQRYGIR